MLTRSARIGAALAAVVTLGVVGRAAAQAPEPFQEFRKLADGVYAALPRAGADVAANSGFIIGTDGVWVFDALRPDVSAQMLAEIRRLTALPVKYVINSHHHYELVLGNGVFAGATIVSHEKARRNLIAAPPESQLERTKLALERLGLPPEPSRGDGVGAVPLPSLTYTDRLVFHDGNRELHLIHLGRYHTDADSVLFLPKERILFSGDLLPGLGGPGGQREAYFREFIASLDKALTLEFDTIVPGRGDKLATKADLRRFQQYFRDLLAAVQPFVDRGATVEEAQKGVRVPDYVDRARLDTSSFKRLWADSVARAYNELKAERSRSQP